MITQLRSLSLAVLLGCSTGAPPATGIREVGSSLPPSPTTPPGTAPVVEPLVPGPWSAELITGAPVGLAGLVAASARPLVYVGAVGGGEVRLGTQDGERWIFETLAAGRSMMSGTIAVRGDQVATTASQLDTRSSAVLYLARGAEPELVVESPDPLLDHAITIDSRGPVIVTAQDGLMSLLERREGRWSVRGSWQQAGRLWIEEALVDAADRVHVHGFSGISHIHHVIDGARRTEIDLPADTLLLELAGCGGAIHGMFEVRGSETRHLAYGTLRDDRWELGEIGRDSPGFASLGFDEVCRPFIGIADEVWARGASGWLQSTLDRGATRSILALVGSGGTLYAAYEQEDNGVSVGIAIAHLGPEAP